MDAIFGCKYALDIPIYPIIRAFPLFRLPTISCSPSKTVTVQSTNYGRVKNSRLSFPTQTL